MTQQLYMPEAVAQKRQRIISSILIHKFFMELHDPSHPLCARCQKGRPDMESPFFLSETCSRDDAYPCRIQQPQAVELIWLTIRFLRRLDSFLRQRDGWEEIH